MHHDEPRVDDVECTLFEGEELCDVNLLEEEVGGKGPWRDWVNDNCEHGGVWKGFGGHGWPWAMLAQHTMMMCRFRPSGATTTEVTFSLHVMATKEEDGPEFEDLSRLSLF